MIAPLGAIFTFLPIRTADQSRVQGMVIVPGPNCTFGSPRSVGRNGDERIADQRTRPVKDHTRSLVKTVSGGHTIMRGNPVLQTDGGRRGQLFQRRHQHFLPGDLPDLGKTRIMEAGHPVGTVSAPLSSAS